MNLKNLKKMGVISVMAVMLATNAQSRDFGEIFTECGIGAMIAPTTPAAAAVTNITWDFGTTATTTNVSSEESCAGKPEKVAAFVYESYNEIEKDLALGNGEYLDSMVSLAKPDSVSKEAFISSIRKDFASVAVSDKSKFEKSEALYNIIYKNI